MANHSPIRSKAQRLEIGTLVLVLPTDRLGTIVDFNYVVRTGAGTLESVSAEQVTSECDHGRRIAEVCNDCKRAVVTPSGTSP